MSIVLLGNLEQIGNLEDILTKIKSETFKLDTDLQIFTQTNSNVDVDQITKQIGSGGTAILGELDIDYALFAESLLRSKINVMIQNVQSCTTNQWNILEKIASVQKARLICGAQIAEFNPIIYNDSINAHDNVVVQIQYANANKIIESLAIVSDIAVIMQGCIPQVVFASKKTNTDTESQGQHCSVIMRFNGGITIHGLVSSHTRELDIEQGVNITLFTHKLVAELSSLRIKHANNTKDLRTDYKHGIQTPILNMLRYLVYGTITLESKIKEPTKCSKICRIMEAIVVSINTGAPVYIEQV